MPLRPSSRFVCLSLSLVSAALLAACQTTGPIQVLVPDEVQQQAQLCPMQQDSAWGQVQHRSCGHVVAMTGGTSTVSSQDGWSLGLVGKTKERRSSQFKFQFTPAGGTTELWRCDVKERDTTQRLGKLPVKVAQERQLSCSHDGPRGLETLSHDSQQPTTVLWTLGGQQEDWTLVGHARWRSGDREGTWPVPMAWCARSPQGQWLSCHDRIRRPGTFWMMPLRDADAARRAALLVLAPLDIEPMN